MPRSRKGLAGPGRAYVATRPFADFRPRYRREALGRSGVQIDRATMGLWRRDIAAWVRPRPPWMIQRVRASHRIGIDDTVLPRRAPKTQKARIYQGEEDPPYHTFAFIWRRTREGPARFLQDFHGVRQAEAYGGYEGLGVGPGIRPAAGRMGGARPPDARPGRHR